MIDPYIISEIERVSRNYRDTFLEMVRVWRSVVFTWHWWLGLALTVLPWALWVYLRVRASRRGDTAFVREHTRRLLAAGFLTLVLASVLDMTGIYLGFWAYHSVLLPIVPAYLPWDWSVMPVTAMLFYRYFPRVNALLKAAVFSLSAAFIAEPVFIWLGLYTTKAWEIYYSVPLYAMVYLTGWLLYRSRKGRISVEVKHG